MLLRNNWYMAGWSSEIAPATMLARRVCGQALVIFRTAAGKLAALEDRCIHRGMPFSVGGECEGEIIRCPYHGLEFDASGICTKVPGQELIPAGAKLISFPIVEKDSMVWVWVGDADKADASKIVSYPFHGGAGWVWSKDSLEVNANWMLLVDNLLDLSHLQYVHRKTIGGNPAEDEQAKLSARREDGRVLVSRWLLDMEAPAFHKQVCGFTGKVDRWQEIEFLPGLIQFYSGATDANTGAYEGKRDGGMHLRHLHAITPETETRTRYFFSVAHNFHIADEALTKKMHQLAVATFREDQGVLEAQQRRLTENPERALLDIRNDVATIHARRIVAELLAAEHRAA